MLREREIDLIGDALFKYCNTMFVYKRTIILLIIILEFDIHFVFYNYKTITFSIQYNNKKYLYYLVEENYSNVHMI